MKLLQLVNTSLEHEPPVFALGSLLAKRGHKVLCIGYWRPTLAHTEEYSFGYRLNRIDRGRHTYLPRPLRGGWRHARYCRQALAIIADFKPDVIVAYNYDVLPLAVWGSRRGGCGGQTVYYCTEYTPSPGPYEYWSGWGFLKAMERRYVRRADLLVSVEPNRAELQASAWNWKIDFVIPNAPPYDPKIDYEAREAARLRSGPAKLVYAGSIDHRNGLDGLLEAVTMLRDITLDVYGRVAPAYEAAFRRKLRACAAKSNNRIVYHGAMPYKDLALVLTRYDIGFALYGDDSTNVRYAAPAKVFEYLRAGNAVICTDQPAPSAVVEGAGVGHVVSTMDCNALAAGIRALTATPRELREFRQRALDAFKHDLCYDKAAHGLLEWIEAAGERASRSVRSASKNSESVGVNG